MKPGALTEPVLVGRKSEMVELKRWLKSTMDGKGTTIFVSGEAGSGKTRLTLEFLEDAKKEGAMVLTGWCLSNAAQPYFPFVEAFESYHPKVESGLIQQQEFKSWFSWGNQVEKGETGAQLWKDRTFGAITKELRHMSNSRPVILFIDDIHWADSASLALLHYIAQALSLERIMVIATYRTEEVNAKVEGQIHPLADVLRLMAREGLFEEIKLGNLSQDDVGRIAEDMLGGNLDSEFAKKLTEESQGNPLFVVEALRMMYSQGTLVLEKDRWHIKSGIVEIPSKIKDVILRRLNQLKPNERRILDAASVVGEKFNPKLVSAVLSQDNIDVFEALNAIAQSTLLVFCEGSHCQFKHAKISEMLYEMIPQILREEYHSRIAQKIEANQGLYGKAASDLAYHYSRGGDKEKAIQYSLEAGKDDLSKWSNAQAIRHFTYVVEAVGEDPERAEDRETALSGLADAFYAASLFKDAEKTFEELASVTKKSTTKLRALRMALFSAFSLGNISRVTELLKKYEPYSGSDHLGNARVLMLKGRMYTLQRNLAASIECNEAALHVFEEEFSFADAAVCLMSLGTQRVVAGELEGLADSLLAVSLFGELGSFNQQMIACYLAGDTFSNCLLLPEALDMHAKVAEIYEKTKVGNYSALAFGYAFSSRILEHLGDLEKALSYNLSALEISKKTDTLIAQGITFCNLTILYAKLEDSKLAEEAFEKLFKLPPEIRSHYFVSVPVARAALLASKEQWKESNQLFNEFLAPLEDSPGSNWNKLSTKQLYAWALERQKSFEASKILNKQVQKMRQNFEKRFEHVNLKSTLMAHTNCLAGVESEMRFYLINLSRSGAKLLKVDGMLQPGCKAVSFPSFCSVQEDSAIALNKENIGPFQVLPIILKVKFSKAGVFHLKPVVSFIDNLGEVKKSNLKPVTVVVHLASSEPKLERAVEPSYKLEFKSEATEKAYAFLVSAFEEDYIKKRLPPEKSGWRTLMEVTKDAKISKHSMYGQSGRGGQVPNELGHLGLVESRFFSGERGRGGRVLKIRIRQSAAVVRKD